jgi:hypothetical protein
MSNNHRHSPPDGVERVELKVTLAESTVDDALNKLGLDPDSTVAEPREIYFCEHIGPPSEPMPLPLLARGIILRIRKIENDPDDATLKLRGPEGSVDPTLWSKRIRKFGDDVETDDAKIEGDWAADRRLVSASLNSKVEGGRIQEVVADRPHQLRRLLSKAQQDLAADLLMELDALEVLDPIHAWKWKGAGELDADVAAELWELDDGLRFLELSMLVDADAKPADAKRRFEDSVRYRGLTIDANQATKTSKVLEGLVKAAADRRT